MMKLVAIYLLITAALAAIAIYVQVNSSVLSLPVSTGTTVLAIVLPLLAIVNFFYGPLLLQRILQRQSGSSVSSMRELAPQALQLLQFALVVVLLTVSSENFLSGGTLTCMLEGAWQRLFSAHNGRAIERIQNTFNCCGFNSVRDRAWPRRRNNQPSQCSELYGRDTPCVGPWRAAMQRDAGLEFAVAAAVGMLQLVQLVLSRRRVARNGGSLGYRRIRHRESTDHGEGLVGNEEDGANHVGGEDDDDADTPRRNYGAIDEGRAPRVEPSHLGEERNHWRS